MRALLSGVVVGLMVTGAACRPVLDWVEAPVAAVQAAPVVDPSHPLRWTLTPPAGQNYTLAEVHNSRITVFLGAQADAVIAAPTGAAVPVAGVTFACVQSGAAFACATTQNAGQIVGTTAAGTYRVAVGMEFRRTSGAYAARVVSAICAFAFPVVDTRPSMTPTDLKIAA